MPTSNTPVSTKRLDLVRANKADAKLIKKQWQQASDESQKKILEAYRVRMNQLRRS